MTQRNIDTVTFNDRDGRNITGVIVRINQHTATLGTGDGGTWRVPFHGVVIHSCRIAENVIEGAVA